MGVSYRVECPCGFHAEVNYGSGWGSEDYCPCYCVDCGSFFHMDIAKNDLQKCEKCGGTFLIRYDSEDIPMIKDENGKRFFCPSCHFTNLRFKISGLWD